MPASRYQGWLVSSGISEYDMLNEKARALAAENAALRKANQWIKLSDRKPPLGVSVLIPTTLKRNVVEAHRFDGDKFNRYGLTMHPEEWMPLPSPPTD